MEDWVVFDNNQKELALLQEQLAAKDLPLFERRMLRQQAEELSKASLKILDTADALVATLAFEVDGSILTSSKTLSPEQATCLRDYEKNVELLQDTLLKVGEMPQSLESIMKATVQMADLCYKTQLAELLCRH